MDFKGWRRKVGTAALLGFRGLPGPVQRLLVRTGTPNYTVGAVCLFEHEGKVLLLWQPHRHGWSLPGGLVKHGEQPHEAVTREVLEEVGVRIDPGDPVVVGLHPESQQVDVVFRVVLTSRPVLRLATEARKARWCPPEQIKDADRETWKILEALADLDRPRRPGQLLGTPS